MKNVERQRVRGNQAMKYEDAMKQAFHEIYQNLKVIEEGTKKKREKLDLQRRRGSAPPTTLRKTTAAFERARTDAVRKVSTPQPVRCSKVKEDL